MSNKEILLILGNQLFPLEYIEKTKVNKIFMAEDFGLTTNHKHHKLKILMFLWSMRQYKDNLIKNGYTVFYHSIDEESFNEKYEDKLLKVIKDHDIEKLKYFETCNRSPYIYAFRLKIFWDSALHYKGLTLNLRRLLLQNELSDIKL